MIGFLVNTLSHIFMAVYLVYHKKDIKNIIKNWNQHNLYSDQENDIILTIYSDAAGYYIKENNSIAKASGKHNLFCQKKIWF